MAIASESEPWWIALLREQQRTGFADLDGAQASLTLPVSDRLITRLIADRLPSSSRIREVDLHGEPDNRVSVRVRLGRLSFLPSIRLRLIVDRQADFPSSPVIVLRIVFEGVAALAAPALSFLKTLPEGIHLERDRLHVNLATLAANHGAGETLRYVTDLQLTTAENQIIVHVRGRIPSRTSE